MADAEQERPIVVVASDRMQAELIVPSKARGDKTTEVLCRQLLADEDVAWNNEVAQAVRQLLAEPDDNGDGHDEVNHDKPRPVRGVVARGMSPRDGIDGKVQWAVDNKTDKPPQPSGESEKVSFYNQSAYVMVKQGQVIGQVIQPVDGEDGRDVTGKTLTAKMGKSVKLQIDDTILQDARGQLIAQLDGVLLRRGERASISKVLEIPKAVDFSTGNVHFDGDVQINGKICDRFQVNATGTIEVDGLIEAAEVQAGGDLVAKAGIATRGIGHIKTGGDLITRYLDEVPAEVHGTLRVDREAINCQLTVHGDILSSRAAFIGGQTTLTGSGEVGTLGSSAAVATRIELGCVPLLEKQLTQLEAMLEKLERKQECLEHDQLELKSRGADTGPDAAERQTELYFELQQAAQRITRAQHARETLTQRINTRRRVDLLVQHRIHPGVILSVRGREHHVSKPLRGPVRITESGGRAMAQFASAPARTLKEVLLGGKGE